MGGALLVLSADSHTHRRRLGALAWAVLEDLALRAVADEDRWFSAGGVRDIGGSVGVTKDTAARAVAALVSAGFITRERGGDPDVSRRAGYRLHLPAGISLCPTNEDRRDRPDVSDDPCPAKSDGGCRHDLSDARRPSFEDANACHGCSYIADDGAAPPRRPSALETPSKSIDRARLRQRRLAAQNEAQGQLFDLAVTAVSQDGAQ